MCKPRVKQSKSESKSRASNKVTASSGSGQSNPDLSSADPSVQTARARSVEAARIREAAMSSIPIKQIASRSKLSRKSEMSAPRIPPAAQASKSPFLEKTQGRTGEERSNCADVKASIIPNRNLQQPPSEEQSHRMPSREKCLNLNTIIGSKEATESMKNAGHKTKLKGIDADSKKSFKDSVRSRKGLDDSSKKSVRPRAKKKESASDSSDSKRVGRPEDSVGDDDNSSKG